MIDKDTLKSMGWLMLTCAICAVANSVLKYCGIEWLNAYPFALGFYAVRANIYKTLFIASEYDRASTK